MNSDIKLLLIVIAMGDYLERRHENMLILHEGRWMDKKRVGLIGAGRWGKVFIRNLVNHPTLDLIGISSSNPDTKNLIPENISIVKNWEDLFRLGCDGIIIASPPSSHIAILDRCIQQRTTCLMEKPLSLNPAEVTNLTEKYNHDVSPVLVDHIQLFNPLYWELKKILTENSLKIESLLSVSEAYGPFRPDYSSLWDYAPHDFAFCFDLLGANPKNVQCLARDSGLIDGGHSGSYIINLEFPQTAAQIQISNLRPEKHRYLKLAGSGWKLELEDFPEKKLLLNGKEVFSMDKSTPMENLLSTFSDGLNGKMNPLWGLELGLSTITWIDKADKSIPIKRKI